MKNGRAWLLGFAALACGPAPAGESVTGSGTSTTSTVTGSSTSAPTEGGSQTTAIDTSGNVFVIDPDVPPLECKCPEGQICVMTHGIDDWHLECALPPDGCDPADLCTQACAEACLAAPPLPDGCEEGDPPPEWVQCAPALGGECSTWAENCPDGEKCVPDFVATLCTPIDPQAAAVGEPCEPLFGGFMEPDDCEQGALCRGLDPDTQAPVCVPHCDGSGEQPICPMGSGCRISGWNTIALCLPNCDPLGPSCAEGTVCVPGQAGFVCAIDESGASGGLHAPCTDAEWCDAGLTCVGGVPGCGGDCCTPYCDLGKPACPQGHACVPLFAPPGDAPPDWAHVGVCGGN